jgi:hypothetical protein
VTQADAIRALEAIVGPLPEWYRDCTGDATTCPIVECDLCGVRDCPHDEPLHYHHDGCPACEGS